MLWEMVPYGLDNLRTALNGSDNLVLMIECLSEKSSLQTKDSTENQEKLLALVKAKFEVPLSRRVWLYLRRNSRRYWPGRRLRPGFSHDGSSAKEEYEIRSPGLRPPPAEDSSPRAL